jgi:hypothetical protein
MVPAHPTPLYAPPSAPRVPVGGRSWFVDIRGVVVPLDAPMRVLRMGLRHCVVLTPVSLQRFVGAYGPTVVRFDLSPALAISLPVTVRHNRSFGAGRGFLVGLRFAEPAGEVCRLVIAALAPSPELG